MKNVFHDVHRHIKHHHKKYLFGLFGGFAVVKLFLLVLGLSAVEYTISTFAQLENGCTLTGQYYTGEYQTGEYQTGESFTGEYQTGGYLTGQELTVGYLTGGYMIGCTTGGGYFTGGTLDESGSLTGETRVDAYETGCILTGQELTGQELTGGYMTGYSTEYYQTGTYLTGGYLTGGYRTGGYLTGCVSQTGNNQTGNNQQQNIVTGGNGICESGDILWNTPVSGSIFRDIFPINRSYSGADCISGLSLQLRDHNSQRIDLSSLALGTTGYTVDSRRLYSFQQSGYYHIIGNTGTENFYLYTGTYTGNYSRLSTGYKLRLLTSNQTSLYETSPFTIDNQTPILTGISLLSSGSATGYLNLSGVVILNFTASEELSGLQVSLGSGKIPTSSTISGLNYSYTRRITSLYTEGVLTPTIIFADKAGNTGAVVYASSLVFDITRPTVTDFVFSGNASGFQLKFISSEPVRYTINYGKMGGENMTRTSADYLTAQYIGFSGVEIDQFYTFSLNVFDKAGNGRALTGDFTRTTAGTIIFHAYIVPVTNEIILSGSLVTLGSTLKNEIEKFNACKSGLVYVPVDLKIRNTVFAIQMPNFQKSQVKTLVNAFTLFLFDKVKLNRSITPEELTQITKKFDNFLIILKLLRDDDNICKQNLSNYHIVQFKNTLEELKINLE